MAYGLYAEQLSGTPFTAPRHANLRSWLYRIRPAVMHEPFVPIDPGLLRSSFDEVPPTPSQLRWDPLPEPERPTDWLEGLVTVAGNGGVAQRAGMAAHLWAANRSMEGRYFYDADGDLLFVPESGRIILHTEMGRIELAPGEIAVIPRGVRFRVELVDAISRGYLCENFGLPFRLPDLGPIGANGLANPRDFLTPAASYEDLDGDFRLVARFEGLMWEAKIDHCPLDVVAWHGNYVPYKYDLARFNTINTVSYDHPDPSIFTVLTSPTDTAGTANVDFVIFPPRWMVAENTFRPPYFHRNFMNEYMGLISGSYDAKAEGFVPGGGSLHNCMSGHGPDAATYAAASTADLKPQRIDDALAFMFETRFVLRPSQWAMETPLLQKDYWKCWSTLERRFSPPSS